MAKMNSPFSFRGPLGNLSVYYRSDLDMEIVRGKGGAIEGVKYSGGRRSWQWDEPAAFTTICYLEGAESFLFRKDFANCTV